MKIRMNMTTRRKRILSIFPVLLLCALLLSCFTPSPVNAATTYIFTTFKGDAAADEKLWVYTSSNGTSFNLFSQTGFGGPTGVLRDPSIMKHTDGKYYIAFTVQSWTTSSSFFAIASSSDLKNWTNVTTVNAGVSGTYFTWAPEWFNDGGTVKIIVSLGPSGSMRPYIFTAQNSALTSWSTAVDMGIGTNHIDSFVVKSGSTYHVYCKDESSKYIEHATAASLTGPWTWAGTGNWTGWGSGFEAPALCQMDDGSWRIYVDKYSDGSGVWTATSSNLNSWTGLSNIGFYRHGTVLRDTSFSGPTPVPSSYVKIRNAATGLFIDGMGRTTNGSNAGQYSSSGSYNQQWVIETTSGYVRLKNRATGLYLDGMGRTSNGSVCGQYSSSGSNNQQWTRETSGSNVKFKNRATGLYIDGMGSTTNGADLCQYSGGGSANQQWQIVNP
ncbi:MAG TPA: RICIN domain-containing protein [Bacillota bacterium]|nr:RICIN domain-containing protein [Bacillota bacterium]